MLRMRRQWMTPAKVNRHNKKKNYESVNSLSKYSNFSTEYSSGEDEEEEEEMNYDEIESMLDERLPDELKNKKKEYEERFKTVVEGNLKIW